MAFLDRNGIEYFEVFFGCALLGAVQVAVNWRLAPSEMAAIIEDAGAAVLFYGPDYAGAVEEMIPQLATVRRYVPSDRVRQWRDTVGSRAGRRPRVRARPPGRRHPALHLGHHRAAQGRR